MPREPKTGICTVCKTEKPLFDVKNMVCGSCAGKKGGCPPKAIVKKPPEPKPPEGKKTVQKPPGKPSNPENPPDGKKPFKSLRESLQTLKTLRTAKTVQKSSGKPLEKPSNVQTHPESVESVENGESVQYQCDACGATVRYGQHKCRCGTWIDWRGSPVQDDPDLVICPECGAICGHVDAGISKCPHCNY